MTDQTSPSKDSSAPAATAAPGDDIKKYILVAEDDAFYGNIFKLKLSNAGYDVQVATDGQQALELASQRKPHLMLLDLIMPVKDGFETLKELKNDPKLKDIKVVIMSNLGQESDIQKTRDLGAADYLIKTNLSVQQMVEVVQKYLA